jgi:hypothetical protein
LLRRKPGVAASTAMQLSPMRCGIPKRYFRGLPAGFAPDDRRSDSPFNRIALRIQRQKRAPKRRARNPHQSREGIIQLQNQKYRAGKRQRACQQRGHDDQIGLLAGFPIEGAFRGRNQQTQHKARPMCQSDQLPFLQRPWSLPASDVPTTKAEQSSRPGRRRISPRTQGARSTEGS